MNIGVVNKILQRPVVRDVPGDGQPRTVAQAAIEMNVATSTVRAWIAQRRLGHIRLGRSIRVPHDEIRRVMEEGYTPARRG
jgi:excisionase family DNA binding protein